MDGPQPREARKSFMNGREPRRSTVRTARRSSTSKLAEQDKRIEDVAEAADEQADAEEDPLEEITELVGRDENLTGNEVILWRPSVRVRLATNLPPEMYKGLTTSRPKKASSNDKDSDEGGVNFDKLPPLFSRKKQQQYKEPPHRPAWNLSQARSKQKPRYGAWYLPVSSWKVDNEPLQQGWQERDYDPSAPQWVFEEGLECRVPKERQEEENRIAAIKKQQTNLESQIETLYSGKVYKEYIKKQGDEVPHYLAHVETPPEEKRRRPRITTSNNNGRPMGRSEVLTTMPDMPCVYYLDHLG
ncbi:hypothetical protein CYMTET_16217 [Cymbomonas tetramitiformis]|uniref:Uncharacterized protein n=1 Tax=Cymbomonas tetramitiformis TaxID=36881 RepID=A0AAE0GCT0_9CHLO|nr:hypothetical protein CYMTET_16217 [Cymbomonas tetramitiformis]